MDNERTKTIEGNLYAYFETGTEGIFWTIVEDKNKAPEKAFFERMHILEEGDLLTVFTAAAAEPPGIVVRKRVSLEYDSNAVEGLHGHKQQAALGYYVHGLQKDFNAGAWAMMFFAELPAKIERKNPPEQSPKPAL